MFALSTAYRMPPRGRNLKRVVQEDQLEDETTESPPPPPKAIKLTQAKRLELLEEKNVVRDKNIEDIGVKLNALLETMKPGSGKNSVDARYAGVTVDSAGEKVSPTGSSTAVLAPLAPGGTQGAIIVPESQIEPETGDKVIDTTGGIGSSGALGSIVQGMIKDSMKVNNDATGEVLSPYLVLGSLTM